MNPILSSPYAKVREHLQHPSGAVAGAQSPFARDERSLIAAASHAMADCVVAASGLPSPRTPATRPRPGSRRVFGGLFGGGAQADDPNARASARGGAAHAR